MASLANRRCGQSDAGFTLVETLITSVLTLVVLGMGYGILRTTTTSANTASNRAVNAGIAKQVVDSLETNLRYATAVTVCGPGSSTASCTAPSSATTATLAVANQSGGSQSTCTLWGLTSSGLTRTIPTSSGGSGVAVVLQPGVSAAANAGGTATYGFNVPSVSNGSSSKLVQIDLAVNADRVFKAGDTVTVHELIAPDNSGTAATPATSSGAACS